MKLYLLSLVLATLLFSHEPLTEEEENYLENHEPLTEEEENYLENHKTLRVSSEFDWPPYDFVLNGVSTGYSIDFITTLLKPLGVSIEFVQGSWEDLVEKFCTNEIDILHPADKSETVSKCANFSEPIIKDTSQFLVRNSFKRVNTLKDLYGYRVATPRGWQQTEVFKNEYSEQLTIIEVKNTLEAIEKVKNGEADFAYDYGNVLRYLKTKHHFNGVHVEGVYSENSEVDNLYIAISKDNQILFNIINKALRNMDIGDLNRLNIKWFGDVQPNQSSFIKETILIVLFVSIFSLSLYWNRKLKLENRKLENRKLEKAYLETTEIAIKDRLTSLYNRHKLDELLVFEKANAQICKCHFGIIIVDVDHFKNINDNFGHLIGDTVLMELSTILLEEREENIVGRWGGEEFFIIVPDTDTDRVINFAEKIREKVESYKFKDVEHITISLGGTIYTFPQSIEEIVRKADIALYNSKRAGRNRVTFI